MSFANFDLESQKPIGRSSASPHEDDELSQIIDDTSKQLQTFGTLISQLDLHRKQVGSRRDTKELRATVEDLSSRTGELEKVIQVLVLQLSQIINNSSSTKGPLQISARKVVVKERLVNEFNELHRQFQRATRIYKEQKRAHPLVEVQLPPPDENTPLINEDEQQQTQLQLQEEEDQLNETELQYHVLLTEERNREISKVTQGIQEVNSIFKDLSQLVTEQGQHMDTIEDNILQLNANTQEADQQLVKAHEYQKKKGKWTCILLIALSVFILIAVLAVLS